MKKIYTLLSGLLLILPFLFFSCEEDYMEKNLGDQPLTLSVGSEKVILDITAPESNAIEFEWTPGSNFNTNAAITYTFELTSANVGFENSIRTEFTQGVNSVFYTNSQLNTILLEDFGITPGNQAEIQARVTANVHVEGFQPQVSEIVKVAVMTYQPVSSTLYLIGDATPTGWDLDEATQMNLVTGSAGGFVWQGRLEVGALKFITTLGSSLPSYGKGDNETSLRFRESDEEPDNTFDIQEAAYYKVSVNIINLTISIQTLDGPEYNELWFTGDDNGWSFDPMILDESDPFIFRYNTQFTTGGEFKIATAESWDAVFYRPIIDQTGAGLDLDVNKWAGEPDNKWNILPGVYKIKLDTRDMKIDIATFTPYSMMYLVGDATPNGWDIDNATPMSAGNDPYIFTWTGILNQGDIKFSCDKQGDWNGDWFLATQDGAEPTGTTQQMLFSSSGSNPDNKWKITTSGTYTIELDQLKETVKISKQ